MVRLVVVRALVGAVDRAMDRGRTAAAVGGDRSGWPEFEPDPPGPSPGLLRMPPSAKYHKTDCSTGSIAAMLVQVVSRALPRG